MKYLPLFFLWKEAYGAQGDLSWKSQISVGTGQISYFDGEIEDRFHLGAQLILFRPDLEVHLGIATQSPLQEGDSSLPLPPKESDILQITQASLRQDVGGGIFYKLGMFPDTPDGTTPILWPYVSVALGWQPFAFLALEGRRDSFAIYAADNNDSEASSIERIRIEGRLTIPFSHGFQAFYKTSYNFFYDPDHALPSLSTGRFQYLSGPVTDPNQRYSLWDHNVKLKKNWGVWEAEAEGKWWDNEKAQQWNEGQFWAFKGGTQSAQSGFQLGISYFEAGQNSVPPSVLNAFQEPGFCLVSQSLEGFFYPLSQLKSSVFALRQQAHSCKQGDAESPGNTPQVPEFYLRVQLEYQFGPN